MDLLAPSNENVMTIINIMVFFFINECILHEEAVLVLNKELSFVVRYFSDGYCFLIYEDVMEINHLLAECFLPAMRVYLYS